MFSALWQFRHFIISTIFGEFKSKFARSRLGLFWSVLHPLAQALIFSFVLSEVMSAKLGKVNIPGAYPIYLMSGLAAWSLFTEILNRSITVFIDYSSTLKKIAFPRLCLPMIIWGAAMINHFLLLLAMILIFLFFGHYPNEAMLSLFIGAFLVSFFAFGLGIFLGILNVFSRDIGQIMNIILQLWFWVTPIVYSYQVLPEKLRPLILFNPMAGLIQLYQDAILFGSWPDLKILILPVLVSTVLILVSLFLFRRAGPELVDAL